MNDQTLTKKIDYDIDTIVKLQKIQKLSDTGQKAIPELLDYLADDSPYCFNAVLNTLQRSVPVISLYKRWDENSHVKEIELPETVPDFPVKIPEWITRSCEGFGSEESFVQLCIKKIDTIETIAKQKQFLNKLVRFTGIHKSLSLKLKKTNKVKLHEYFNEQIRSFFDMQFPLQINLSPTMNCQLHCEYCVSGSSTLVESHEIPLGKVKNLIKWAKKNHIKRIGLTGGEPTIYPYFGDLLKLIKENDLEVYLATNGIINESIVQHIIDARPLCVTMHLTPEVMLNSHLLEHYKNNIKKMKASNTNIILRCNFQHPSDDYMKFISIALEFSICEIRIAVPTPNSLFENKYTDIGQLHKFGQALDHFVFQGNKNNININLAKPFPICMLKQETAKHFLGNGSFAVNCPIHITGFTNNIVIYPDLTFSPCLSLKATSSKKILEFKNPGQAAAVYKKDVETLFKRPLIKPCTTCPLWDGGRCIGACISYRS